MRWRKREEKLEGYATQCEFRFDEPKNVKFHSPDWIISCSRESVIWTRCSWNYPSWLAIYASISLFVWYTWMFIQNTWKVLSVGRQWENFFQIEACKCEWNACIRAFSFSMKSKSVWNIMYLLRADRMSKRKSRGRKQENVSMPANDWLCSKNHFIGVCQQLATHP